MKLTVNIKKQSKIAAFLNLIKKMDYVEIVDIKDGLEDLPLEHRDLLDDRLLRIKNEETSFKNWDVIKKKYESNEI